MVVMNFAAMYNGVTKVFVAIYSIEGFIVFFLYFLNELNGSAMVT